MSRWKTTEVRFECGGCIPYANDCPGHVSYLEHSNSSDTVSRYVDGELRETWGDGEAAAIHELLGIKHPMYR